MTDLMLPKIGLGTYRMNGAACQAAGQSGGGAAEGPAFREAAVRADLGLIDHEPFLEPRRPRSAPLRAGRAAAYSRPSETQHQ